MDNDTTPLKRCTKCGNEYPATTEYFYLHKGALYCHCKPCHKEKSRQWYVNNPEKAAANRRVYHQENKDRLAEYNKEWRSRHVDEKRRYDKARYESDPEHRRSQARRWSKANPEKRRIQFHTRRSRERSAPGKFTKADLRLQYKSQKGLCWWCSEPLDNKYHVDHIIPLSRGGTNWPNNIVCACPHCNVTKHDRLPHEWNGRLF